MSELVIVNNNPIAEKIWKGQRVVTLSEVARVHGRKPNSVSAGFQQNKSRFVEGQDYFMVLIRDLMEKFSIKRMGNPSFKSVLLTKSGYLLLTKTLTDERAWGIQRELVDNYFNPRQMVPQVEAAEHRQCQDCHRLNAPDAVYCDKCGVVLKTQEQILSEKLRRCVSDFSKLLPDTQRDEFRDTILIAANYIYSEPA